MFKRFAATLALAVVLVAAVAPTTPASAIMPLALSDCSYGTVCLWDNANITGLLVSHYGAPGTCYNLPASANDKAEFFYNHLADGHHFQAYRDANCSGPCLRRNDTGSCGPFQDGLTNEFWQRAVRPSGVDTDRNKASSLFYNVN